MIINGRGVNTAVRISLRAAMRRQGHHTRALLTNSVSLLIHSRKPRLVLRDVLKTEKGKAYLDSQRWNRGGKRGRQSRQTMTSSAQRVGGGKSVSQSCRHRSGGREAETMRSARKGSRSLNQETLSTPKRNQERLSLCSRR